MHPNTRLVRTSPVRAHHRPRSEHAFPEEVSSDKVIFARLRIVPEKGLSLFYQVGSNFVQSGEVHIVAIRQHIHVCATGAAV
jgi:hypothetical protein